MSKTLDAFRSELTATPEIVDRFFSNGKFNVAALLEGAEALGYEIEAEMLNEKTQTEALAGNFSFLVPDSNTGDIKELSAQEIELVAAGVLAEGYRADIAFTNVNVVVTVYVVAAVLALMSITAAVAIFVLV